MSDVLKMQLDIQNNLEKNIQQSSNAMKGFNSLIEKSSGKFENVAKTISSKVVGAIGQVKDALVSMVPLVGAVFSGAIIADAVVQVLQMNDAMTQLSYRMGHSAEGVGVLKNAVYEVNQELGISMENSAELVSTLTTMRVPLDMMDEMATTTGLFSELTGVSATQAAELTGNLVVMGNMGQDAVDNITGSMFSVQRAVGLTESEMNALSDSISASTRDLNNMGKSAGEIESYNKGITQLAGAFASVGVEADKALSIMDDLLDPGKVEDHAFLLSQLGVSMGDAFEGNIDPAQLATGFRDLGQTLQGMTGPAAAAMADELGMSVRDLRQLGNLGEDEMSKVTKAMADGASGAEAMAAAFEDEATPLQRFERTMEKIKGRIGQVLESAMPAIEWLVNKITSIDFGAMIKKVKGFFESIGGNAKKLIPMILGAIGVIFLLMRKRFQTTATEVGKTLETGVAEGIEQGARKGRMAVHKEFASARDIDLRVRTEGGSGFKNMMADAELLEIRAESMGGFFGNVMRKTAGIHKNLANSAKPLSAMEQKTAAIAKINEYKLELARNERKQIQSAFETRIQDYQNEKNTYDTRIKFLEDQQSRGKKLRATEQAELLALEKIRNRIDSNIIKQRNRQDAALAESANKERRAMNALSDEKLISLAQEQKRIQNNAQMQIATISRQVKEAEETRKLAEIALASQKEKVNIARENGTLNEKMLADLDALNKRYTEAVNTEKDLNIQREEQLQIARESRIEFQKMEKISQERGFENIAEGARRLEAGIPLMSKAGRLLSQAGRNVKRSLMDGVSNLTSGARKAAGAFADRFRKENIGATLRGGARRVAGAAGRGARAAGGVALKGLGGLMKLLGPVALIAGVLRNMEPVQKITAKVMEKLQGAMEKVAEALMPIIDILFEALMPVFDTLVAAIVPLVEGIVKALVPIISRLLSALGPILEVLIKILAPILEGIFAALLPLINMLLPPLIWVLGAAVQIIGHLVEAVGRLLKFMMELPGRIKNAIKPFSDEYVVSDELRNNAIYKMSDSITNMGSDLAETGRTMRETAFDPVDADTSSAFTKSIAEGTAQGNAQSEITRTWEPAQIRALRDGIAVEQGMTETISGEGSSAERTAANTEEQTRIMQEELIELRRQNELLETQIREDERRHSETTSEARRTRASINSPNNAVGLGG